MTNVAKQNRPYPHFKFPNEITISVNKMSDKSIEWHGVKPNSYEFRCTNYGWFPTEIVMGVQKNTYIDNKGLGAVISGNMGTASIAIVDAREAIILLQNAGYNIETENGLIF